MPTFPSTRTTLLLFSFLILVLSALLGTELLHAASTRVSQPVVATLMAYKVKSDSAVLAASVAIDYYTTTTATGDAYMEWGTDATLSTNTKDGLYTTTIIPGTVQNINATLTGLTTGTTYYYRGVFKNTNGTATAGAIYSFKTAGGSHTATPATVLPANCEVKDATGWGPGNISTDNRLMATAGGVVVSYKFTANQLITGAPSKRGHVDLYETTPEPRFEISNKPCDMSMPLPIPNNPKSFLTCARVGGAGNRYPSLTYMASNNPNNPAWDVLGYCALMAPDAGGFYYVNVKMPTSCENNVCKYFLWYFKQ